MPRSPPCQEQLDSPFLRTRLTTLCSSTGLKNGCLQSKNVRDGKHPVWGYCSPSNTQHVPVVAFKPALTADAPCRQEARLALSKAWRVTSVLWYKPWGKPCYQQPAPPVQKLLPVLEQARTLEGWGLPHAALQHGAGRQGGRAAGHPARPRWRRPSVTGIYKASLYHAQLR